MPFILPSGFGSTLSSLFNFNNSKVLDGTLTANYTAGDDDFYDWGWGDYPVGTGSTLPDKIVQKYEVAKSTKNTFWAKALTAFAVYGPNFILALKGINSKITQNDVLEGNENVKSTLQSILSRTGGSLNPNDIIAKEIDENREANILGIKTSYFVLGGFGLLAYRLFRDDFRTSNKKQ